MRESNRSDTDDRAVSTVLGYSLTLGITMILISGLLISMGGLVDSQRERSVRSGLEVIGQKLAADVTAADRLVETGVDPADAVEATSITHDLPETVAGSTYTIELRGGSDPELLLETRDPAVTVRVTMATTTPVSVSSASGGAVRIRYADTNGDGDRDALVIENG
jgi:type II secretory pathway pseudopilin PulG